MIPKKIFEQIEQNIQSVINRDSTLGNDLWNELLKAHPADIAQFFTDINHEDFRALFKRLPFIVKTSVFEHLSDTMKITCLSSLNEHEITAVLESIPTDEITDLFEDLSDEDLKRYFGLLRKKDREQVLALMQFSPESAGGIMDINAVTLQEDFTVEQSIQLLQRLQPEKELHQVIYVTDRHNKLMGYINLEDLVLNNPKKKLATFIKPTELVVNVSQDQEDVAKQMVHYHLMSAPVTSDHDYFLGIITSDTLVDVIEEEAAENVYKISAMTPIKQPYFETPFIKLFYQRSNILVVLLLVESLTYIILDYYHDIIGTALMAFMPMLVSVGGNTSNQTSVLAIQGLTSGEINYANMKKFLWREFLMSFAFALLLGATTFIRIYYMTQLQAIDALAISLSLGSIVILSVTLGSALPIMLQRIGIDPAFSAGPFLATIIDIIGTLIYCYICWLILF
jgi:magnesium transporter